MARILTSDTTDLSPHELPATRSGKPEKDAREDVLGDGSIKKQLLYAGTKSKRKPQKGDYCRIHYNCELPNGREIDSTRDRGLPHPFTLYGNDKVIEGWSHAVATMQKGEVARFHIESERAYGPKGFTSKDKSTVIPAHATLVYDIELVSYTKNDDITEEKDGTVRKSVTRRAKHDHYPNKRCDIDYSYDLEVPGASKSDRLHAGRLTEDEVPGVVEEEEEDVDADDVDWGERPASRACDEADLFSDLLDGCDGDPVSDEEESPPPQADGLRTRAVWKACDREDAPRGLRYALEQMPVGQHATITLAPEKAFGATGSKAHGVPPDSEVVYRVTVHGYIENIECVKNKQTNVPDEGAVVKRILKPNHDMKAASPEDFDTVRVRGGVWIESDASGPPLYVLGCRVDGVTLRPENDDVAEWKIREDLHGLQACAGDGR
ncbi:FK506 binding protein [Aureococcus anophagefferens]|nr:FK506 binding protein [Aureococcus anophagefferens]